MRIDRNETIQGYKMSLIRDLLRRMKGRVWSDQRMAEHFHITLHKASRLADALAERGLIESERTFSPPKRGFVLTDAGHRFCAASFLKPIPKCRADALVADLLVRVEVINTRDELVYRVAEVHVFGSYYRGEPEVGDADLAVRLVPRRPGASWYHETFDRARNSGQVSLTFPRMLKFGTNEVLSLMRARTRYLHITEWETFETFDAPSRRIFPPGSEGDAEGSPGTGQGAAGGSSSTCGPTASRGASPRHGRPGPRPAVSPQPVPVRPAA